MAFIHSFLRETLDAFEAFAGDPAQSGAMEAMAALIAGRFRAGGKLLICGNGGSAADAQHIAGEFVVRLMFDRDPLPAVALTTDSSVLTAAGNDYGYEHVFERQVRALGREGDVLLGISTSGGSANVLAALKAGRGRGMACLGFTGAAPGVMGALCEIVLAAPSRTTAIIQQIHITAAHVICALVERELFPEPNRV